MKRFLPNKEVIEMGENAFKLSYGHVQQKIVINKQKFKQLYTQICLHTINLYVY